MHFAPSSSSSTRAARFASMTGIITFDLASNQSQFLEVFLPKVSKAVFWMVSQWWSHFSEAELRCLSADKATTSDLANSATVSGCCIFVVSMRGFPAVFVRWILFGFSLNLLHTIVSGQCLHCGMSTWEAQSWGVFVWQWPGPAGASAWSVNVSMALCAAALPGSGSWLRRGRGRSKVLTCAARSR